MTRRQILWGSLTALAGIVGITALAIRLTWALRDLFRPKSILEPATTVKIGRLSDFPIGVHIQFLQEQRICIVRNTERLYAIYARCPHQGCTPDWIESQSKFMCPCHGSHFCLGSTFNGDGINCDGPAPRPLDRAHIELDSSGQVVVNTLKLYRGPKNDPSEFDDPGAYIPLTKA